MPKQSKIHNPWREQSRVNPQRENGHRRINSEIWHALMESKLPGAVYQVVMTVIDRSWGYDQNEAAIGYAQFIKATRLSRQSIIHACNIAETKRLLVIKRGSNGRTNTYLFNKHYDTWLTSQANHTSMDTLTSQAIHTTPSQAIHTTPSQAIHTTPSQPLKRKVSLPTENLIERSIENNKESIYRKKESQNLKKLKYRVCRQCGYKPKSRTDKTECPKCGGELGTDFSRGVYGHMVRQ